MNRSFPWLAALAALTACGKESAEDPAEHACENVGAADATLTATADTATAPALAEDVATVVTLAEGGVGYVSITLEAEEALLLWTGTADVVTGLWDTSGADILPEGGPNELCAEDIPEHFDLDLGAGTYVLELGPSAVTEVWLMLTPAEGHGHDE
ncbi:hypothetical protein L6R49_26395 [Myxococcota bacterium]|nr:hypothetical protein [Myxococcota bacterium]